MPPVPHLRLVLALALAAATLGAGLGEPESGGGPDESLYVSIARETAARGEWLTPTLEGAPSFYKPPLLYWAQHLSFTLVGPTVFAARLPVLLSALGAALLFAALVARAWGERFRVTGFLLFCASAGVMRFGRLAMMDLPLVLMLTLAAWAVWRATHEPRPDFLVWTGVAAGGASLLKGPAAALMVLVLVVGFLVWTAPALLKTRWAAFALLAAVLTGVPWYAAAVAVHGRAFVDAFIGRENLGKLDAPWTLAAEAKVVLFLLLFALPWTFLALPRGNELRQRHDALKLAAAWLGAVLLPVSLSSVKMTHWLLPALPAVLLLAARPGRSNRWLRLTAVLFGAGALAVFGGLRFALPPGVPLLAALAGLSLLAAATLAWRAQLALAAAATLVATGLVLGLAAPRLFPPVPELPVKGLLVSRHLLVEAPNVHAVAVWREEELQAAWARHDAVAVRERDLKPLGLVGSTELARWPRLARNVPVADVWLALRLGWPPPSEDVVVLRKP